MNCRWKRGTIKFEERNRIKMNKDMLGEFIKEKIRVKREENGNEGKEVHKRGRILAREVDRQRKSREVQQKINKKEILD